MRGIDGIGNLVLVIMAAASLILMIAVLILDSMINHAFYSYGLQFSYSWAIPYWNTIGIIFALAWLNIIAPIAFQIYRIRTIRKEERESANQQFEPARIHNGEREVYGITIVRDQTATQEAEKPVQIVPYEPAACEQIKATDSKKTEE
jgi:hypothetical protein